MPENGKASRARNGAGGPVVAENPKASSDTVRALLEQSELLREAIVRIANLEDRVSSMADASEWGPSLMGAVATLQDRVGAALTRRGDAGATDTDLESIRASLERVSGRIGVVESLREPIADLAPRVAALDELRTAFGQMPARLDQMAMRADQLTSRMDQLTTSVDALRALPGQIRTTLNAAEKRFEARATDAFTRFAEAATSLRADLTRLTETLKTDVQHANDAARTDVQQTTKMLAERVGTTTEALCATVETQVSDLRREIDGMAQTLRAQVAEAGRSMRADLSSSVTEELAELHEPARALARAAAKVPDQELLAQSMQQAAGEVSDAVRARVDVLTNEVRARVDGLTHEMAAFREGVALKDATVLERVGTRLEQVLREVDLVGNALNEVWTRVCAVEDVVRSTNGLPSAPAEQLPKLLVSRPEETDRLRPVEHRSEHAPEHAHAERRLLSGLFRRKRDERASEAPHEPHLDARDDASVELAVSSIDADVDARAAFADITSAIDSASEPTKVVTDDEIVEDFFSPAEPAVSADPAPTADVAVKQPHRKTAVRAGATPAKKKQSAKSSQSKTVQKPAKRAQ